MQYPTGRVRLIADHLHIDTPDLASIAPERLHLMTESDPAFQLLLANLGWIKLASLPQEPQPSKHPRNIVSMEVVADPAVLSGAILSGPVTVRIVKRNGDRHSVALASLDGDDLADLIRHHWAQVPEGIRHLDTNPATALQRYVLSKQRGYLRT